MEFAEGWFGKIALVQKLMLHPMNKKVVNLKKDLKDNVVNG
jgi:hypothetical protein